MSNHYSAANLKFPGDDARLDFTDLYAFASPDDPGKTDADHRRQPVHDRHERHAAVPDEDRNSIPTASTGSTSTATGTRRPTPRSRSCSPSSGTARRPAPPTTPPAPRPGSPSSPARCSSPPHRSVSTPPRSPSRRARSGCSSGCAATRSSPTRTAPSTASSGPGRTPSPTGTSCPSRWRCPTTCSAADPAIGVWATVSLRRDGALVQVDRGGHPTINPFINPNDVKNEYNLRQPADDLANYLELWSKLLEEQRLLRPRKRRRRRGSCCPTSCATTAAEPAAYPNGRTLDRRRLQRPLRLADQRQGRPRRPQAARRPAAAFPYLGPPNRYTRGAAAEPA